MSSYLLPGIEARQSTKPVWPLRLSQYDASAAGQGAQACFLASCSVLFCATPTTVHRTCGSEQATRLSSFSLSPTRQSPWCAVSEAGRPPLCVPSATPPSTAASTTRASAPQPTSASVRFRPAGAWSAPATATGSVGAAASTATVGSAASTATVGSA